MICDMLYLVTFVFYVLPVLSSHTLANGQQKDVTSYRWVEDPPKYDSQVICGIDFKESSESRPFLMLGQFHERDPYEPFISDSTFRKAENAIEHPLRTDQWDFNVHWTKKERGRLGCREDESKHQILHMDLHRSGYARVSLKATCSKSSDPTLSAIGRWYKRPWGVTIIVRPLETALTLSNTSVASAGALFVSPKIEWVFTTAAFHWNPFRNKPKMTQGTIIRQRPTRWIFDEDEDNALSTHRMPGMQLMGQQWFRPIVGTFTANGV
jgi:hypothetical protein